MLREPASVYLDASRRLEEQTQRLRELGMMLRGVGEVLSADWRRIAPVGGRVGNLSSDFPSPQCAMELSVDDWPNATSLVALLENAYQTLAEVREAWEAVPHEWRYMLPQPPLGDAEIANQQLVA